jgi:hypothetical protein
MKSINQFLVEAVERDRSSNKNKAIHDVVDAIKKSLDGYDLPTRKYIWEKITSAKGNELMNRIVKNPKTYLSDSEFTKLAQKS